ncbi:IDEAL domain-containing protein [Gracilibacillus marinus]|uniref:IDEAL domain-containing protein n=1 Tax=Gracilibacillus marinus TaxID=630535 RepID=A0ABV8VVU7_9BACI
MKKQKMNYQLVPFVQNSNKEILARREISYEIKLASQLILDNLCFNWNKARLDERINQAIDDRNHQDFIMYSDSYKDYIWES